MKIPNSQVAGNWLVLPDLHIRSKPGGEDKRSIDAVLKYANEFKPWSGVILLGDVMDNNSISHHNKGLLRKFKDETIFKDYERANKVLDMIEQATQANRYCLIEGNHDYRVEKLVDEQPQLEGLVETQNGLRLQARGWDWIPFWSKGEILDVGKASFIHGKYTNEHHAKKNALAYGRNVYYGHTHSVSTYPVEREGSDETYEGASLGCLCEYNQDYLQGSPTKWQQSYSVFRFQASGFFNRYTTLIFNHSFISPEGRLFKR